MQQVGGDQALGRGRRGLPHDRGGDTRGDGRHQRKVSPRMNDLSRALSAITRRPLAHLPTPLEELPRLTAALRGPRLLVGSDEAHVCTPVPNATLVFSVRFDTKNN